MVQVSMVSDLFAVPSFDFPEPEYHERFFVEVQTAKGRRFRHEVSFPSVALACHEDGERFYRRVEDAQDKAQALADRVEAHLKAGGKLDWDRWNEDAPVYGSQAYIAFEAAEIAPAMAHLRNGGNIDDLSPMVRSYF